MTTKTLQGKVALITGASSGINFGIAASLASAGASVAILSRNQKKIDAARDAIERDGGRVISFAADVRESDKLEAVFSATRQTYGAIDIVVSGAAGNFLAKSSDMSANAFKTVIDIDLIGTFNVFRASLPFLREPGASLIAITAPQGEKPTALQVHVCAAKAGVNMLTKVMALELGPRGIRVNAISPGPIAGTEGVTRLWPTPEALEELRATLPLSALGRTEDISGAVAFLVSDQAAYITGTILDVDGGYRHSAVTLARKEAQT